MKEQLKILFYVERDLHLPFLEPIYDYFSKIYDYELAFLVPKYVRSTNNQTGYGLKYEEILRLSQKAKFIQSIDDFKPDLTYVADVSFSLINCGKIVNVGHGLISKGGFYRNSPVVRRENLADLVCVPGQWHKELLINQVFIPIVTTGFIKFDGLYNSDIDFRKEFCKKNNIKPEKKIILYAPTFNNELSAIPVIGNKIFDIADDDNALIIKLHSMTDSAIIDDYKEKSKNRNNVFFIDDIDITKYLIIADIMISDVSSVVAEFITLKKPVIVVDNQNKTNYSSYNPDDIEYQIRDCCIVVTNYQELKECLLKNKIPDNSNKEKIELYSKLLSLNIDGQAAARAAEAGLKLFKNEISSGNDVTLLVYDNEQIDAHHFTNMVKKFLEKHNLNDYEIIILSDRIAFPISQFKFIKKRILLNDLLKIIKTDFLFLFHINYKFPVNFINKLTNYFKWYPNSIAVECLENIDNYKNDLLRINPNLNLNNFDDMTHFLKFFLGNDIISKKIDSQNLMLSSKELEKVSNVVGYFDVNDIHLYISRFSDNLNLTIRKAIDVYILKQSVNEMSKIDFNVYLPPASIIILTYNSSSTIEKCLGSVKEYLREGDEVIVVDNNSRDNTVEIVRSIVGNERKFTVIQNQENIGFSAGMNLGIRLSRNPVLVMLNPDTIVTRGWLESLTAHFADEKVSAVGPLSNSVAGNQKLEIYVQDEIEINSLDDISGHLRSKYKGQNLDVKMLMGFCLAVRREFIEKYGGLDEDLFLGNDDLELSWRIRTNGGKLAVALDAFVYHVGQASFKTENKSHTDRLVQESTDALYKKLENFYGVGKVPEPMEIWGIDWFKPSKSLISQASNVYKNYGLTSIIILAKEQYEYTKECIDSIFAYTKAPFELVLVDNGSRDNIPLYFTKLKSQHKNVKVITNTENVGFPKGVNQALKQCNGKYILIGNNDTIVTPGWLEDMIDALEMSDDTGIVGPMSNNISGLQLDREATYEKIDEMLKYAEYTKQKNYGNKLNFPRVAFFCTLIKREVFDKIGGLDEIFSPGNYEDDDFCMRAQVAGFKTYILKYVFIHHYRSRSFADEGNTAYKNRLERNKQIFIRKWGGTPDEIWLDGKSIRPPELYVPY